MTVVRDAVIVHPQTVVKAEILAQERRKRGPRKPPPPVITYYKKRPQFLLKPVWDTAWKLAEGDYHRLVVESPTSVLVRNHA